MKTISFAVIYFSLLLTNLSTTVPLLDEKIRANSATELNGSDKKERIIAFLNGECVYNGIELNGRVKFVDSFEDIRIKYVSNFADIHVQFVTSFPDNCGEWQEVEAFEDFKVKIVTSFEDISVKVVDQFPGIN